jgi:acyl-CoA reductase-like NAD-dependent aldehyde dehydrogenase
MLEESRSLIEAHEFSGRTGFKASGLGRGCGPEGVDAYLETQTIVLPGDYVPSA